MRLLAILILAGAAAGCGADGGDPGGERAASDGNTGRASRGGTFAVGDDSWTFVPSIQCSVYPGNVVSIAGHAAEDPSLEIVIDYDAERGPVGARIGDDGSAVSWHAMPDTLRFEIDGRRVRGVATFNVYWTGAGESAPGSFDIHC
jgi:hypothetical protein